MQVTDKEITGTQQYLIAGLLSSITASICCIGPFFLLATGISGAWMSRLMILEPFQPLLITLTMVAFSLAGRKLFLSEMKLEEGNGCPAQFKGKASQQKYAYLVMAALAVIFLTSEYWIVLLAR